MGALHDFLRAGSRDGLVPLALHRDAVIRFGLADADVEDAILSLGLLPERYLRNTRTISRAEQLRLFRSHVAVVGCGGLGGYVTEELCRIGVGTLTVIDPDVFEEHNLNRQLHATLASLGEPKVEAVRKRTGEINPAATIITRRMSLSRENGQELLAGANLAVDALDSIPARIELAGVCERLNIPLAHGSVGVVRSGHGAVPGRQDAGKALCRVHGRQGRGAGARHPRSRRRWWRASRSPRRSRSCSGRALPSGTRSCP